MPDDHNDARGKSGDRIQIRLEHGRGLVDENVT